MDRRRFLLTSLAGAFAEPLAAGAQQAGKVWRIGFLGAGTATGWEPGIEALRLGLRDHGYVDGRDFMIEYRWAENRFDRLPDLAAELVRLHPDVIITHGTPCTLALKRATLTIPIVMSIVGNPVENGLVSSLAQPGGNITGSSFFSDEVTAKRLEILKTGHPPLRLVGFLTNPQNVAGRGTTRVMEAMAQALSVQVQLLGVRTPDELDGALTAVKAQTDGVVIADDQVLSTGSSPRRIADFMLKRRLPSIGNAHYPQVGGLLGYGVAWTDVVRRSMMLVDRFSRAPSRPTCPSSRRPSSS